MRRNVKLPLGELEKNATSHDPVSADRKSGLNRRVLLSGGAVLPVLPSFLLGNTRRAAAQQASSGFSFAVYGDSRPMVLMSLVKIPIFDVSFRNDGYGTTLPPRGSHSCATSQK